MTCDMLRGGWFRETSGQDMIDKDCEEVMNMCRGIFGQDMPTPPWRQKKTSNDDQQLDTEECQKDGDQREVKTPHDETDDQAPEGETVWVVCEPEVETQVWDDQPESPEGETQVWVVQAPVETQVVDGQQPEQGEDKQTEVEGQDADQTHEAEQHGADDEQSAEFCCHYTCEDGEIISSTRVTKD